jgi:hypothetical protein
MMKTQDEPQSNMHVPAGVSRDGARDQIPACASHAARLTVLEGVASH